MSAPLKSSVWRVAFAAALVAAALGPAAGPAPAAEGGVRLLSQTSWVSPGAEFVLRLGVDTPDEGDLELSVAVHQAVLNRTQFRQTIDGRVSGSPIQATSAPLRELERDAGGAVRVVLPVHEPATAGGRERLILRRPGVYPVRVELRQLGGGEVVDRLTTHLVYVAPTTDGPRLGVTVVVPIHAPPARQPDGEISLPTTTVSAIADVARAVAASPATAVLAPTPETLTALAEPPVGETLDAVRRAAATRQVIAGPFVPVAPTAFGGPLEDEAAAQRTYGTDVVRRLVRPDPSTNTAIVDAPTDEETIARLRDQQVDRVVVPESALAPIPLVVTLAQPFQLRGRQGRQLDAAVSDAGLAAHAASGEDAVLGAHHLLADLAVIYFDSPGLVRGVVAAIPRGWSPDAAFVETALSGLSSSPVLDAINLDQLFDRVPPATGTRRQPLVRDLAEAVSRQTLPVDRIVDARRRLTAFASVPEPGAAILPELEERLLVAESADLRPRARDEHLDGFNRRIDEQIERIHIPRSRSITLTAREGEIPVTVRNNLGYGARVVLQLSSDKLEFPGGERVELELDRRNTTQRFRVRARTSGSFPLQVLVLSPDGALPVAESRFTVRSTAASGVGVILSIGAVWFLLLWWLRHVVRNRRARRTTARA